MCVGETCIDLHVVAILVGQLVGLIGSCSGRGAEILLSVTRLGEGIDQVVPGLADTGDYPVVQDIGDSEGDNTADCHGERLDIPGKRTRLILPRSWQKRPKKNTRLPT